MPRCVRARSVSRDATVPAPATHVAASRVMTEQTASLFAPPLPAPGARMIWTGLPGSSRSLAVVEAAQANAGPLVVITEDARQAQLMADELRFYLPADDSLPVLPLPDWECLPYDAFSPHPDIVSQRLLTLHRALSLHRGIVVVSVANLMQRLPPTDYVMGQSFTLEVGERIDIDALRARLQAAAYHAVGQVMAPGEYAVRGGLIDIFPMGAARPFRLDLFGDEIESIRYFDPETQRSESQQSAIRLLPAKEFPMTEAGIKCFRSAFRRRFEGDPQRHTVYREVSQGHTPAGVEYLLPLFFAQTATLFDYMPEHSCWLLDGEIGEAAERAATQVIERFESVRLDPERPALSPDALFLDADALAHTLADRRCVEIRRDRAGPTGDLPVVHFAARPPADLAVDPKSDSPYARLLERLRAGGGRVLLVTETPGRRQALEELLHGYDLRPQPCASWDAFRRAPELGLALIVADLERGLDIDDGRLSVITEAQLYGERVFQRRRRSQAGRDPESVIRSLAELNIGDPVVHEDQGVGRYRGLTKLGIDGELTEFLTLEYQDGDRLYVPVLALHLIGRYVGGSPDAAPLHKLGGEQWARARRRAEERARDVAAELLELEALRAARRGHAFPVPTEPYHAFADAFPFEETPDQAAVIDQVLDDMRSDKPMDRLVCGDVGFGKTEIALRAAFLAVHDGYQVAVLVPTTLLAQQHFESFRDRFAELPVEIELLSRFRGRAEIADVLRRLATGRPDIVIGTHRLLQPDVRFERLGLVILDEEHRFGVRQKERLKRLRAETDVLTLTATPIPRTLNMAMAGLRAISIIATPPRERLSIKTFVREWSRPLIREACLREIRRGGQVYVIHNEVRTIERTAAELGELLPEATIRVAHGQMPERQLEDIMRDFYHQRFNVLVCTTIIESGIDVPTANTIVINRADRFGLAQLHQLRGRVGRSHHQAYAYLLVASKRALTADASKRLEAIESLEDLGAGFALASHDLEIRGAGELLGESQSGVIDEVGFTLYSDYLRRAITSMSRTPGGAPTADEHPATEVNLHVPALFPDDYVPDVHTRLVMYKRIANAHDLDALHELQVEMVDRFGLLPEAGKNLFRLAALKLRATPIGVRKIDVGAAGGRIEFVEQPHIDPMAIVGLIQSDPAAYRMANATTLRIERALPDLDARLETLATVIETLSAEPHSSATAAHAS